MNNFGFMVRCKWLHLFQLGCFGRTLILMLGVPCHTYFLGVCHFTSSNQHNRVIIFLDSRKRCAHPQPFTPCRNPNNLTQNRINKLHQHWLMYLRHSLCLKLQCIKFCWSLLSCPFNCIGFSVLLPYIWIAQDVGIHSNMVLLPWA